MRMIDKDTQDIQAIYDIFRTEVIRKADNGGKIIIPEVIIEGEIFSETFYNVEVTAHNLRNDTFKDGVVTAIDVIMTLSDQGLIDYSLQWYDSIGTAEIVKSYWVESINNDAAHGRCGFVYECGEYGYEYFRGNHIHLPSD